MNLVKRLHNLIELSKIEISPNKQEQISNIINEPPKKMAEIIHRKTDEDIIKEILNEEK